MRLFSLLFLLCFSATFGYSNSAQNPIQISTFSITTNPIKTTPEKHRKKREDDDGNNKCEANKYPVGGMIVDAVDAVREEDVASFLFVAKDFAVSAGELAPEPAGAIVGLLGGLVEQNDETKDCLAQLHEEIQKGFEDIKKQIDEQTEIFRNALEKVQNETRFEIKGAAYFKDVENEIYHYNTLIMGVINPDYSADIHQDLLKRCYGTEDSSVMQMALNYKSHLKDNCDNVLPDIPRPGDQRDFGYEDQTFIPAEQKTFGSGDQKSFGITGCLIKDILDAFEGDYQKRRGLLKQIVSDGVRLQQIAIFCLQISNNTVGKRSSLVHFHNENIMKTMEFAEMHIMNQEIDILDNKTEQFMENATFILKELEESKRPRQTMIEALLDSENTKGVLEEACNLSELNLCVVVGEATDMYVRCETQHCRVFNVSGLHILLGNLPRKNETTEPTEAQKQTYALTEDAKTQILRQYGSNSTTVFEQYRLLKPYAKKGKLFLQYAFFSSKGGPPLVFVARKSPNYASMTVKRPFHKDYVFDVSFY